MDAIEQLELLTKGPPPPPPKKGKKKADTEDGASCPKGDDDQDGAPNAIDADPDDPDVGAEGEEDAAGAAGDEEDDAFGEEMPEDEEDLAPGEEEAAGPPGAGGDLTAIVDQIAAAEKDFYAARGMHGTDHHKAELAMETFHKLVRKLAKQVHPEVGNNGGGDPMDPNAPDNGFPQKANGNGDSPFPPKGGNGGGDSPFPPKDGGGDDKGPPEEVVKEAKKAGWSDAAIDELFKAYELVGKQDMLEPLAHDKMRGKMEPDPANYCGDPNGGQFIDWGTSSLVGHMNEAGGHGEPSGITGDNPYEGSNAGEAHPHHGYDKGPLDPASYAPAPVPSAKMGPQTQGASGATPARTGSRTAAGRNPQQQPTPHPEVARVQSRVQAQEKFRTPQQSARVRSAEQQRSTAAAPRRAAAIATSRRAPAATVHRAAEADASRREASVSAHMSAPETGLDYAALGAAMRANMSAKQGPYRRQSESTDVTQTPRPHTRAPAVRREARPGRPSVRTGTGAETLRRVSERHSATSGNPERKTYNSAPMSGKIVAPTDMESPPSKAPVAHMGYSSHMRGKMEVEAAGGLDYALLGAKMRSGRR